jgi:hypothetical protein
MVSFEFFIQGGVFEPQEPSCILLISSEHRKRGQEDGVLDLVKELLEVHVSLQRIVFHEEVKDLLAKENVQSLVLVTGSEILIMKG